PEVKKAGGVYYTPQYIVDYIVRNTVGKLVEGKTPKEIAEITILDPACGSGSFLIGAYTYLLQYHLDWYMKNKPKKHKKAVFQVRENEWYLTTAEKKRILLNNIYGVDIDSQAVEVTKLSLQLKVLENESREGIDQQVKLGMEGVLPNLGGNIKCGNSLIGPDFYDAGQVRLFDEDEMRRVNVFDWADEVKGFGEIMSGGGFDCVIGNPPYVDIKNLPDTDVEYLFATYPSTNNRINLFAAFIERALELIQSSCFRFSMIVPTALLTQSSYRVLRRKIADNYQIDSVTRLPNESFGTAAGDVKVDTVIAVIKERDPAKTSVEVIGYSGYDRISEINPATAQVCGNIQQAFWAKSEDCIWSVNTTEVDEAILQKCSFNAVPLEECAEVSLGLTPYDKYKGHAPEQIKNKVFHANFRKDETFKRLLAGNDVMRYLVRWNGEQWISYGPWLGAPREQRFFTKKRIIVKQIIDWTSKRIWASITDEELYNTQNAFNLLPKPCWSHEYLLGILNSHLMTFYHRKKFLDEFKMRFQKILIKDCRRLPIRTIDFTNTDEKTQHDKLVALVDNMLELQKKYHEARMERDKEIYERQIKLVDAQIDRLVYDLYGLTEEEINVVEGDK
ncbi:MAG: N-6 DNA methylase, partial [Clostridiales bacterium]|nr:N-6 DNA methylase [Clostridiales bacterium]